MTFIRRSILFFEEAGSSNTIPVVEAVRERLNLGGIEKVVVPVTTGKTARLFSSELKGKVDVITISEDEALSMVKKLAYADQGLFGAFVSQRLEEADRIASKRLRRDVFDMAFLPFSGETWDVVKEILYAFGQGMKVAIEVSVAAVEVKKVEPYTRIIAVGGSEGGVDTAVVLRTAPQREAFRKDYEKRLIVQEIICMPMEK